jgi:hypothetical protein
MIGYWRSRALHWAWVNDLYDMMRPMPVLS